MKDIQYLTMGDKVKAALLGINNPKPVNERVPQGPYETVRLHSNKTIEGWYMPVANARGTVILFHGYMGAKGAMLDRAEIFKSLGYNTLLVDFMGSGGSEGDQTTIGFKEAEEVKTSVAYVKGRGENNIVLMGQSMGAAAVMKAMSDEALPVSKVILECPFGTMMQTVKNRFSAMGLPTFPMAQLLVFWGGAQNGFNAFAHNPMEYAKALKCPTLLIYGAKDERVTGDETKAIYENLAGPKRLVTLPRAGHADYLITHRHDWTDAVSELLL
jgi:pimeloyl-ACP methyl ester carboxylesterase